MSVQASETKVIKIAKQTQICSKGQICRKCKRHHKEHANKQCTFPSTLRIIWSLSHGPEQTLKNKASLMHRDSAGETSSLCRSQVKSTLESLSSVDRRDKGQESWGIKCQKELKYTFPPKEGKKIESIFWWPYFYKYTSEKKKKT